LEKTVQKLPFLRLLAALATGILIGSVLCINFTILFVSLTAMFGLLVWMNHRYNFRHTIIFGTGIHLALIIAGILIYQNYNRKPTPYQDGKYLATVMEILQEKPNSYQSVLKVNAFQRNDSVFNSNELVMVWFAKNEESKTLEPGKIILFDQSPQEVKNSNNPYEFDYKKYLARKKIYRQVYLPSDAWTRSDVSSPFNLEILAEKARMHLLNIYHRQKLDENELHVLSALTLGYKRGLDPETKRIFASAGAMHVLAVSGLHVGIVFIILSFLLGFMKKQQAGRIIFVVIIIFALWSFAFITGLSPSVKRAATMFTFVVIGQNIKRQLNIYNTLAASAFLLLLLNPNNLFEAGFQLSYSAVTGIVFLQPRFDKLLTVRNKVLHYAWSLLTVSVAAQIATFPVSVYYFNQFPSYFWISNLLVIPAVTLLIPLGMATLAFHWIPFLSDILTGIIGLVLNFVILFLASIEMLPLSVLKISFSDLELVLVLGILLSVCLFIDTRCQWHFRNAYISVFLFLLVSFGIKSMNMFRKEIIVYNYSDQTIVHLVCGKQNYVISENPLPGTGMVQGMIDKTVVSLRMHPPVFLSSGQLYNDSFLYVNKGLIFFDGRIIGFNSGLGPFIPEVLVGSNNLNKQNTDLLAGKTLITTQRRRKFHPAHVHYLVETGAYREKW
jgi:competence protein ComEC